MSVSPIANYGYTPYGVTYPAGPIVQRYSDGQPVYPSNINNATRKPGDLIAKATYSPNEETLKITQDMYMTFDAVSWITIEKDGSGNVISCWGRGTKYPATTFSSVLEQAKQIYQANGKINEEGAKQLLQQYSEIADKTKGEDFNFKLGSLY